MNLRSPVGVSSSSMQLSLGKACLTTTTQLPLMSSFLAVLLIDVCSSSMFKFEAFVPIPEHVKMKLQRFSGDQKKTCLKLLLS